MAPVTRVKTARAGYVVACPECDKAGDVYLRRGSNTYIGDPDADYACGKCSATFDEYVERPVKPSGPRAAAIRRVREALGDSDSS